MKHWQQATHLAESCLEGARRENELLMSDEIPELRGQNERAKSVINQLHDEVSWAVTVSCQSLLNHGAPGILLMPDCLL